MCWWNTYRDSRGVVFFLGLVRLQLQSGCGVFCGNFFRQAWCDLGCNWALLGVKCVGGCKNHVLVIGYCWHTQLAFMKSVGNCIENFQISNNENDSRRHDPM